MKIVVRAERNSDYQEISMLNDLAFGQENEGLLIEALRKRKEFIKELSLVAILEGQISGHILFTPVSISGNGKSTISLALAPMCVMPELQNFGIGSQLVEHGLKAAQSLGFRSVIVLGHKEYYPRFGFKPASFFEITCPFEVPDECFMALELQDQALIGISGMVSYPIEFDRFG